MKRYRVTITETLMESKVVEAENWDEARDRVQADYADGKIVLTAENYFDSEIVVEEIKPPQKQRTDYER